MIRRLALPGALALCLLVAAPAQAATPPEWKLTVVPTADYALAGSNFADVFRVEAENVGGQPTKTSQPIVIEDIAPAGATIQTAALNSAAYAPGGVNPSLPKSCPIPTKCVYPEGPLAGSLPPIQPHQKLVMTVTFPVSEALVGPLEDRATITGGGAAGTVEAAGSNLAAVNAPFGTVHFDARILDASKAQPYTQAGGHPFEVTSEFDFETASAVPAGPSSENSYLGKVATIGDPKHVKSTLPAGLIANPQAIPTCSLAEFFGTECPISTMVGTVGLREHITDAAFNRFQPVFDLQPSGNYPGQLGGSVAGAPLVMITSEVRSDGDYGIDASAVAPEVNLNRSYLTLWGIPADPAHNALRTLHGGPECSDTSSGHWAPFFLDPEQVERRCEVENPNGSQPSPAPPAPFVTMPTGCSGEPLVVNGRYDTWQAPGEFAAAEASSPPVDGCSALRFEPTIGAQPSTNLADSPAGFEVTIHVPQNEDPESVATSELREAVVKLPAGLTLNASSANGLGACSPTQVGLTTPVGTSPVHFTDAPADCPDASVLGTAEVNTNLLHAPLDGSLYLATPFENPSRSLLAGYLVLEGQGIRIKLAGEFQTDHTTGQITARFLENPQLPFEDFHVRLFGGARASLRTPPVCGTYETTSVLTPWSHLEGEQEATPIAEPTAEFETTEGPQGGACPHKASNQPNTPVFRAGTESPVAGAFTPFAFKLAREDGSQEIEKIETTLPPGLTAKLAGVAECSEAQLAVAQSREHEGGGAEEQGSPSCPASSEVGTVEVASGAGPAPLYVTGHAYLAGPYKGAPLSLAIITPAVAGPFDLGDVLVRTALYTDPYTTQIKAVSDPIPHILQGIPLDVRSITLKMARPNFTLNPTDCKEMGFAGTETSLLGNVAPLAQRFQVGGCRALPFKPKLAISLKGGTKRHTFPALTATLTMPPGQANIAKAQVTLPHAEQLEQAHITSQVCLQAQLATQTCPKASIYGYAKAETPLLDHPLEGPVYLGVGFGHELPDLVAELNGQIRVLLHGKVDTGREDGLRNTFEVVPDAPVSKFTLHMFGGKKSLIVNSQNLCGPRTKRKVLARFTAQSGSAVELEPTVATSCKKKHKKGKRNGKGRGTR